MSARRLAPALLLLFGIAVVAVLAVASPDWLDPAVLSARIDQAGDWAPLLFVLLYCAGTVLFLPGSVFSLVAGALFGPVWGLILNLTGATLGATGAFLIARHLASDWVRRRTGPRLERFIRGIEAEGWRFVAFVRLVPLFPFNVTNYALGLTRIGLLPYVMTSLLCMVPGALAYTWLGHAGRAALAGDASGIRYALAALGLLSAIVFLPRLVRRLRGSRPVWIDVDDLMDRPAQRDAIIVDVRGAEEFAGPLGHIPGAVNLPLDTLASRLSEIKDSQPADVILVCRTDKRSASAAALLREVGLQDVRVLRGGMEAWNRAGRAVERAAPCPGIPADGEAR